MQPSRLRCAPTAEAAAFSRLLSFAHFQWPGYRDGAHHRLICRKLEAVERGDVRRLMISMPPRHGKSMLASEYFPAWYLGRNPDHYVIAATYSQDLADDFGRKVRNQIADPAFGAVFPGVGLRDDSTSVKRFHVAAGSEVVTAQAGAYYAVGVGGPLTGRGAHLLLIDDPIKNREEADSEAVRRKIKDWYTSTAYTRLMPGGRIVLIQTRWHDDDLAGWLCREHLHEGWDVLSLPAIDQDGKALWPEQYDQTALLNIKRALSPRDWAALYQQQPTPDDGDYFKSEWLRPSGDPPPLSTLRIYGASDYAVTANGGDYTVHIVVGLDPDGRMWLLDLWRKQSASDEWVEAFCDLVSKYRPVGWAEETGQIKSSIGPWLERRMRERGAYVARESFPTRGGDKAVRAQSIRGRMALNGLYIPAAASWRNELIAELLRFPAGVHDDQVDALGLVGQLLDKMTDGSRPEDKPMKVDGGYRDLNDRPVAGDVLTL